MSDTRLSLTMEIFVELSRQEPFRTGVLFLGFLTTRVSLAVLSTFVALLLLSNLPFVHLGFTTASVISMVFSLYFTVGFIVWYKHEGFAA